MAIQPLVSVLIPMRNGERWIAETVASVQAQTCSQWELIIVNDKSDDRGPEIVSQLAHDDTRIHLLENQGEGILPALQTAFQHSRGTYITRHDHDDLMTPLRLEEMRKAAEKGGPKALVIGLVEYFADHGELGAGFRSYATWLNETTINRTTFRDIYRECTVPSPAWLTHRNNLLDCNAFNHSFYPEDYELAFRFRKAELDLVPVNKTVLRWRDHPNRISRKSAVYADNRFTALKVRHFLEQDHNPAKALVVWGAGKRGKQIAQRLTHHGVPFRWACNNPRKVGHEIYGVRLEDVSTLEFERNCTVLVAVGAPEERTKIQNTLVQTKGLPLGEQVHLFC